MRRFLLFLAALGLAAGACGADAELVAAPFDAAHWELDGGDIGFATYLGEPALRIHQGSAMLRGSDIGTGTIEYDIAFQAEREFPGVHFRGRDDGDWEYFYLRPHKNSGWDSNQYMPVIGGAATWQLYSGAGFNSTETYKLGAWNRIRIELYPTSADVFINGVRSLRIPELKSSSTHGFLAVDSAAGARQHDGAGLLRQLPLPVRPECAARRHAGGAGRGPPRADPALAGQRGARRRRCQPARRGDGLGRAALDEPDGRAPRRRQPRARGDARRAEALRDRPLRGRGRAGGDEDAAPGLQRHRSHLRERRAALPRRQQPVLARPGLSRHRRPARDARRAVARAAATTSPSSSRRTAAAGAQKRSSPIRAGWRRARSKRRPDRARTVAAASRRGTPLHWTVGDAFAGGIDRNHDGIDTHFLALATRDAHGAHEPVGDPRDPEAHRAAGDHLARRRPAFGADFSGRGRARGDGARPARHAARGAPVRGERGLRAAARMGRGRDGAPGPGSEPGAGADHDRLAARPRPRRQGADRCRQPRRRRIADLPRRAAGVRSLRARVRRRRRRRRRAAARRARHERRRRALPLRVAQLPESERPLDLGRPPRRARRRRSERRRADRRGQPVRRPLVRRRAAGADRFALARRDDLSRQLLEGPRAGASPRLRDRSGRGVRQAGAGQAGRRPAHAGFQPAHRPRDRPLRLSRRPRADDPQPLPRPARRHAGRARRAPADLRAARVSLADAGRRHVLLGRAAGRRRQRGAARQGGRARRRLRSGRAVFRRRGAREHLAPVVRHRRRRGHRARHRRARRRLARPARGCGRGRRRPRARSRARSSRDEPLRLHPGRRLHRDRAARQSARRRARRRRARRGAHAGVRALDQPERDDLPARAHRPGRRLPRAHLHAGRRAALRRPSDARQLPRVARARRPVEGGGRGRPAVRRRPGPDQARRRRRGLRGTAAGARRGRRRGARRGPRGARHRSRSPCRRAVA